MTQPNAVREVLALAEETLAESAARLAERTGLLLEEARALLAGDPRVDELRRRYVQAAAIAPTRPAPRIERVDESELPEPIRNRIAEIRACSNVVSVTVTSASDAGELCIVVPDEQVAEGGGWGMPTEPHVVLIPNRLN